MKFVRKTLTYSGFFLVIGCTVYFAQVPKEPEKVKNYLDSYLASISERPGSLRNHFVGFLTIDDVMQTELQKYFPKQHFYVAKTLYTHWIKDDGSANILVVTNAETGEVVGHRWAIWFSGGSESFDHILETYEAASRDDAVKTVGLLSKLLVSLNDWPLGNVKLDGKTITAELGGTTDPWRLLKVKIDKKNKFGPMVFINPKDKN